MQKTASYDRGCLVNPIETLHTALTFIEQIRQNGILTSKFGLLKRVKPSLVFGGGVVWRVTFHTYLERNVFF